MLSMKFDDDDWEVDGALHNIKEDILVLHAWDAAEPFDGYEDDQMVLRDIYPYTVGFAHQN